MVQNKRVWACGAMSGTSLDGVDWAIIETDGQDIFSFGASGYRPYSTEEQNGLRAALGTWPDAGSNSQTLAHKIVMGGHRDALQGVKADLFGFHGQTLNHDPASKRTFQIGDGSVLAQTFGRPVVWDFRSADVAAGGQGAPLAPFYHHALARWAKLDGPIAFLNLGGVGNITWIGDPAEAPEATENLLAFDTGPANAPINDLMMRHFQKPFDAGGTIAAKGTVSNGFVAEFLTHSYFKQAAPKSLDRDQFSDALLGLHALAPEDAVATATALIVASVKIGFDLLPEKPKQVLVCGGGRHNPVVMQSLKEALGSVHSVEKIGVDGDMLEAQAFGYLAVRVLNDLPISAPGTTGVSEPMTGGRISRPD